MTSSRTISESCGFPECIRLADDVLNWLMMWNLDFHCCNSSITLMWHAFDRAPKLYPFLILNLPLTFLPIPFPASYVSSTLHPPGALRHLWPFTLTVFYTSDITAVHRSNTPVLSLRVLVKSQIVLSLSIWLPDIKRDMNSCSRSPLVLSAPEARGCKSEWAVLSAVYIGRFWFAQAKF